MREITAKAQTVVRASPIAIYNSFVRADMMSKFWFARNDQGLIEGETVQWYVGHSEDAFAIEVRVKELICPEKIVIEWGDGQSFTQVLWRIESSSDGVSKLFIEESGFSGTQDEIVASALESTGGFNQVVIALKALLEHQSMINVVDDHI
ncbi:MAG: SRPBCC domain-containing protein [Granulosicoccus sp.]|nr:SRPBCC domain-containing protein [Granulosicoccus sp.]